jgi:hypothetical protein
MEQDYVIFFANNKQVNCGLIRNVRVPVSDVGVTKPPTSRT